MGSTGGDFPSGCGPNVPHVNKPQCSKLVAPHGENANMRADKSSMEVGVGASGNSSELVNISVLQQLVRNLIKSELIGSLEALLTTTCKANGIDLSSRLEPKTSETMQPKVSNELPGTENQADEILDIGSTSDVKISDAKKCLLFDGPIKNSSKGVFVTDSSTSQGNILSAIPTNTPKRSTMRSIEVPWRRVSAVRRYPPFCGRNAPCPTKEECLWINSGNKARSEEVNRVSGRDEKRKLEDIGRPLKQTAHLQNSLVKEKSSLAQSENKGRGQEVNNFEVRNADLKKRKLKELGKKQTTRWGNSSVGKKPSTYTETNTAPKTNPSIHGVQNARVRVLETLALFHAICNELLQEQSRKVGTSKKVRRVDLEARSIIRAKGKEVNTYKQWLGSVPGVEVGDEFLYRAELVTIGVHRQYQSGIDYMKNGSIIIATSIIASEGGYSNDRGNDDVLIYSGHGGNITGRNNKTPEDQKLEKGNLALKNCISTKTQVRVTRGYITSRRKRLATYTYDGLYMVEKYWRDVGPHGKLVYMFELKRVPGQPKVAWKTSEVKG